MRYIVLPQQWSPEFPYETGFMCFDTLKKLPWGWARAREAAQGIADEWNAKEAA